MNELRCARTALTVGGALSIGMGGLHLWLPRIFDWHSSMASVPASLRWALVSLNAFWSLLAIGTGTIALRLARYDEWREASGRFVAATFAAYWGAHAAYLAAWPFPLPPRLAWLGWAFSGFAMAQCVLHGVAAGMRGMRTPRNS